MRRKYLLNKWALGQYDHKSSGSSQICICRAHFKVSACGDRETGPELERPAVVGLPWPPFPFPSPIPSFPRSLSGIPVSSGPRWSSLSVHILASVCVRFRSLFYSLIHLKIDSLLSITIFKWFNIYAFSSPHFSWKYEECLLFKSILLIPNVVVAYNV